MKDGRSHPFVSVIIPVLNDSERLRTCLSALEGQSYPKSIYEVVVVDNGSGEDIEPLVAEFPQTRLDHEARRGAYVARNKGLAVARGEVIAFTDADCIPARDWIERGVAKLLGTPGCGLVAGRINLFFKDPRCPTAVELFQSLTAFPQRRYVKQRFGVTANVFTLRTVIDEVGAFDPKLRNGGDYEWGRRVWDAGYEVTYADDALVDHPARYSLDGIRNKAVRRAAGSDQLLRIDKRRRGGRGYPLGFELGFYRVLAPPVVSVLRILLNRDLGGLADRAKVVRVMLFVRYVYVWERLRLKRGEEPRGV